MFVESIDNHPYTLIFNGLCDFFLLQNLRFLQRGGNFSIVFMQFCSKQISADHLKVAA